jgi:hypothetical protein
VKTVKSEEQAISANANARSATATATATMCHHPSALSAALGRLGTRDSGAGRESTQHVTQKHGAAVVVIVERISSSS